MQTGSPPGEELADRGLAPKRLKQLDVAVADIEQRRVDPLLGDGLTMHERHPQRVAAGELTRLRGALGGEGWHEMTAEDGTVALDLTRVVYVLVDHEGHRVGFGT